ncbi:glycosyltransferase family protein [Pseudanabaena yagii]|uniref:Glycosyltransferase n=1 Tax=Pseudanabaena yagii GIHE-NHR1 TaxID=2722753 RepID=A0ABX1LLM9_9CYAN|nr:glycosyltransferase [Pseudanabaena yagii]NMF56988.1 glycosyltransferase [Pseudanabaena yagii GIHE-NHR1]
MIISNSSKFLLEKSRTPIYQRIQNAFKQVLLTLGHTLVVADLEHISSIEDYLLLIREENPDFILLTDPRSLLASYQEHIDGFLFEKVDTPIIFIHHNNIFSDLYDSRMIQNKLISFYRTRDKSYHFCLEYDNFVDLRSLGIDNTFSISHASEFIKYSSPIQNYRHELSFLGHLLPSLSNTIEGNPFSHFIQSHVWRRIVNLDTKLGDYASEFANMQLKGSSELIDFLSIKYFYISNLHIQSNGFRGEIVKRIDNANLDIIGGDPSYIHGKDSSLIIDKENIRYYPPQKEDFFAQNIYRNSQINLNITSLQFDSAVINRVIDIAASGGFVLTDWRSDLESLTGVHKEISYKSIEELNEKISYYLHPDHYQERIDIAEALHQDVSRKYSYLSIVEDMIFKINSSVKNMPDPLCIDLGCGIWKPEGFIGVDIYASPNIDVVANLNRRFPFSDNSADIIRAHDVIEHLDNKIHTMNEIWRISKPNALIDIRVPSTDGRGAFQDPTHVSFWNLNSFLYYCIEYPEYLKLCHSYGFQGKFSIVSLEQQSENNVVHVHAVLKAIKKDVQVKYQEYLDNLRPINLLIVPNWLQPQEQISEYLTSCLEIILSHPQKNLMTILIVGDSSELDILNSLIMDIALGLIIEQDIDVSNGEPNFLSIHVNDGYLLSTLSRHVSAVIPLGSPDLGILLEYFPDKILENIDLIHEMDIS